MKHVNLNYDRIIDANHRIINNSERDIKKGKLLNPDEIQGDCDRRKGFLKHMTQSKVFWIDPMVTDSLLNHHCDFKSFSKFDNHFPFPKMFIEYGGDLNYRFLDKRNEKTKLKLEGLLVSTEHDGNAFDITAISDNYILAGMAYIPSQDILMVTEFKEDLGIYGLDLKEKKLLRVRKKNNQKFLDYNDFDSDKGGLSRIWTDYKIIEDDCLDAVKLGNMVINTIHYINAKNVKLRQQRREIKTIVRKKIKGRFKNQKVTLRLKPYYWLEVNRTTGTKPSKNYEEGKLNCRFWVTGHSRVYEDGNSMWIEPYVKGPENKPWKNNRYELLYKKFRPLLENPELRAGPWSGSNLTSELKKIRESS